MNGNKRSQAGEVKGMLTSHRLFISNIIESDQKLKE
jgi:hypothetical protein